MERVWPLLKETLVTILMAGIIALVLKTFVLDARVIPSSSMYPSIYLGDRVLVNKFIYHLKPLQRGDIIVFKPPESTGQTMDFIKRVIALPGETVEIKDNVVYVNGSPLTENYLNEKPQYFFDMVTIPPGKIFVLGDNRNESFDSHQWPEPFVDITLIKGKAFYRYWPLKRLGSIN